MSENGIKTNEPTTGEIVRDLRRCFNEKSFGCVDCACRISSVEHFCDYDKIADLLESQEQIIKEQKYQLELLSLGIPVQIKELTARAEQAEAFIKCAECKNLTILNTESVYAKCHKRGITFFPFDIDTRRMGCMDGKRGLPQDGEGKHV